MIPTFGVDYAGAHPSPPCLALQGVKFAGRYIEPASDWKTLTKTEADALHAAGVAIVSFYETSATRALAGAAAGKADALGVIAHRADIGMPANRPVYFAVDFNATPAQLSGPVRDYFRGIAAVMPLDAIGGYGGYHTIRYLFDNALIKWGHQAYAWSGGAWDPRAHIQQYANGRALCGGTVDFDRAMVADYGQWPAPSAPPDPTKMTTPVGTPLMQFGDTDSSTVIPGVANEGRVSWLQCVTGASMTGVYDAELVRVITAFQTNWNLGHDPIVVDGKYGAQTEAALRSYRGK